MKGQYTHNTVWLCSKLEQTISNVRENFLYLNFYLTN